MGTAVASGYRAVIVVHLAMVSRKRKPEVGTGT